MSMYTNDPSLTGGVCGVIPSSIETRHFVTNGYPRGGYVYVHRERKTGWYRWYMYYSDDEPHYTRLTLNNMAYNWEIMGALNTWRSYLMTFMITTGLRLTSC